MIKHIKTCENNQNNNLLSGLLNSTLKEMMSLLNAECGSLFLFDAGAKELVLESFYNSGNWNFKGLRRRIGEGIAGKVIDRKIPVLVKDISRDLRFNRNGYNHYHSNSFISIPLFGARGPLGLLNITDKSTGEPFSEKDLELADTLCKYVCRLIDHLMETETLKEEKETLDKQNVELEKFASVGKLAAGVVHQINNPLDGVIRYTNIMLGQMDSASVSREYLLEVRKGLSRIANITKSLLRFSQQTNFSSSQYIDVHQLIDETLETLQGQLNGNIKVRKKYRAFLPKIWDIGLQHVFINIIKNALDAMPKRGTLEISTNLNNGTIEIIFKDTGLGIPDEVKKRIFEPFFTTKDIDKGTGLGLAICNEIINKYEGKIEVESSPGKGSAFTILIPKKFLQNE